MAGMICAALPVTAAAAGKAFLVYIGTYTKDASKGIYCWRLETGSGKLTPLGLAGEAVNPSFLAIHPNQRFLYAVNEVSNVDGQKGGAVTAFAMDRKTGKLTMLNRVSSKGSGPCYVSVDKSGKAVMVANYNSGSVALMPLKEDGTLQEASSFIQHAGTVADAKRQGGPHAHCIKPSPDNRFAVVTDLGLDEVLVYKLDPAKGMLAPNDPPFAKTDPVAGPRHFDFSPDGRHVYVINEIGSSVTAFSWDARRGALSVLGTVSTLPKDFQGRNDCAQVRVHPGGKFLYGSNRGHDSIAVFAIDRAKGTLTPVEHVPTGGKVPRNFEIDPTGQYLFAANQNSASVVVFRIDAKTGKLTPAGQTLEVASPVCVKFVEAE